MTIATPGELAPQDLSPRELATGAVVRRLARDYLRGQWGVLAAGMAGCTDFPMLEMLRETLKTAEARGLGDEDMSAVIKLLDQG